MQSGEAGKKMGAFDKEKVDDAIARTCALYDEIGLTVLERWHVSECIEVAALSLMGDGVRALCERYKADDFESLAGEPAYQEPVPDVIDLVHDEQAQDYEQRIRHHGSDHYQEQRSQDGNQGIAR